MTRHLCGTVQLDGDEFRCADGNATTSFSVTFGAVRRQ